MDLVALEELLARLLEQEELALVEMVGSLLLRVSPGSPRVVHRNSRNHRDTMSTTRTRIYSGGSGGLAPFPAGEKPRQQQIQNNG